MLRAHPAQSYYREEILTQARRATPEMISHRGAHQTLPENSVPAFLRAIELGADAIELDVHATSDGVLVVHHDDSVNAVDAPVVPIAEISAAELKRYPLADGVEIPTLDEVLAAVGDAAVVYVEIKAPRIEPLVVRSVRESSARCAIHSFDHRISRAVRDLLPAIPTGVLQVARHIDPIQPLRDAGARDLWQDVSFIDEELVARAHLANARVIAWTSNDPAQWKTLMRIGVDGICTDRIAEIATYEW